MLSIALQVRLRGYLRAPGSAACRAVRRLGGRWLPPGWGAFPRSRMALQMLGDLDGLEIGGSASNPFGLRTRNVDVCDHLRQETVYSVEQRRVCGQVMPVDLIAPGDQLPVPDQSVDFVISSHVIEHFYDPIAAVLEWVRVSRRYVYIIAPHKDRTFDREREVTTIEELQERRRSARPESADQDRHWSVWRTADFVALVESLGLPVAAVQDIDDKIGNGFAVVIGDLRSWRDKTHAPLSSGSAEVPRSTSIRLDDGCDHRQYS